MATKYKYDKDTDYAALMERAAQRGDNAAAAIYEQQRNAKIRGEGMTDVTQSNDYTQYLPLEDVPDYDDTHRRQAESLLTERDTTGQRARIDQMLDALLGEEFDYDPASDKLYAAYRQQYERQADLASANALGAAVEERVGGGEAAVVNLEAVLQIDLDEVSVAEVFLDVEAEATGGAAAGLHRKGAFAAVGIFEHEAGVNAAVDLDVSGADGGGRSGEHDCKRDLGILHDESPFLSYQSVEWVFQ